VPPIIKEFRFAGIVLPKKSKSAEKKSGGLLSKDLSLSLPPTLELISIPPLSKIVTESSKKERRALALREAEERARLVFDSRSIQG